MYLAFVPGSGGRPAAMRGIRAYNRIGDYAFPVQQSIAALMPGVSTWTLTAVAMTVTLMLAMLSWHLVEKPAMSMRK
jgi:hypothetical protein